MSWLRSPRAALSAVLTVLGAVVAVLCYRHGVRPDQFRPTYVAGTASTTIVHYSGPWLTGAAGALLVGMVGLTTLVLAAAGGRPGRGESAHPPPAPAPAVGPDRHNGGVTPTPGPAAVPGPGDRPGPGWGGPDVPVDDAPTRPTPTWTGR